MGQLDTKNPCNLTPEEQEQLRALLHRPLNFNGRTIPSSTIGIISSAEIGDGAVIAKKLTKNAQDFITNIVFSPASNVQVNWSTGTIQFASGVTYTIAAGNTGAMAALTYIYFDPTVSTTVLQVTTSIATAIGENVILLCVAENITDVTQEAFFIPSVGVFGINNTVIGPNSISTASIQANAITTNLIAANQVTAAKINVALLSAISVNAGTITAGTLIGLDIATAVSGSRIELDSTNGLRAFNGAAVRTQINVGTGHIGDIDATSIAGMVDPLSLLSHNGSNVVQISSVGFTVVTASGVNLTISAVTTQFNLSNSDLNVLDGNVNLTLGNINIAAGVLKLAGTTIINNAGNVTGQHFPRHFATKAAFKAAVAANEIATFADAGVFYIGSFDGANYWAAACAIV